MRPYTTLFAASALVAGSALARPDGTGAHHHHSDHGAVSAPSAAGSASGYGAPQSGYGAPDTGYAAPDQSYATPDAGYGAPDVGYADYSSGTGYVDDSFGSAAAAAGDSGLSAILIPLLIAAALFLLIPGVRQVPVCDPATANCGKKKRSAGKLHRSTGCLALDWLID